MIAGRMDTRLIIREPMEEVNAVGERLTVSWADSAPVWAERVKLTGRRSEEAAEHFADYSAAFNIRSAHRVRDNWRVKEVGGHLYTVTNIIPNRRRGFITLQCERVNE